MSAQPGIFALGTTDHCYLELALAQAARPVDLVRRMAALVNELSTTGGVNVVVGFRPELWAQLADPGDVLPGARGWQEDLSGADGFTMPATQHDAWLWISAGNRSAIFDSGKLVIEDLRGIADLQTEVSGWLYRHDRDLTGFIDGTENPSLIEASEVVAAPDGAPGAGGSVVLYQLWRHDSTKWDGEPVPVQEKVIGRTKRDSTELAEDDMPKDSHVARTSLEVDGVELPIFRRNVAYGGVREHGTVFVGFACDQWRMAEMLRRMAGVGDGVRCALTRYTTPISGAYYAVPSVEALRRAAGAR